MRPVHPQPAPGFCLQPERALLQRFQASSSWSFFPKTARAPISRQVFSVSPGAVRSQQIARPPCLWKNRSPHKRHGRYNAGLRPDIACLLSKTLETAGTKCAGIPLSKTFCSFEESIFYYEPTARPPSNGRYGLPRLVLQAPSRPRRKPKFFKAIGS